MLLELHPNYLMGLVELSPLMLYKEEVVEPTQLHHPLLLLLDFLVVGVMHELVVPDVVYY